MKDEIQELNDGVYFLRSVVWMYVSWSPCTVLLEERSIDGYEESLISAKPLISTLTRLSFVNSVFLFLFSCLDNASKS